jgi:hypothetical protein
MTTERAEHEGRDFFFFFFMCYAFTKPISSFSSFEQKKEKISVKNHVFILINVVTIFLFFLFYAG